MMSAVRLSLFPAALLLSIAGCAKPAAPTAEGPTFMFVQMAEGVHVDTVGKTLRLVDVAPQTVYFSDRPYRIAGHLSMDDYLREWTAADGTDNLGADNPNASLSVFEPGQPDNTLAIVKIANPRVDGADLVYTYTLIDGQVPSAGGPTALFIDKVGVGGGVGPGYHGVGVGARGPGVR